MKKEEIYFLRKVGIFISDEMEIVTTDSVDKFPDITTFLNEMNRISNGNDWLRLQTEMRHSVYTSCMMHYTVEVSRKGLISQEFASQVFQVAEKRLREISPPEVIALTLLYEGPYYLHPEIFEIYRSAGYSELVSLYTRIFGPIIEKVEEEKDFSFVYGDEYEAYIELANNFVRTGNHT